MLLLLRSAWAIGANFPLRCYKRRLNKVTVCTITIIMWMVLTPLLNIKLEQTFQAKKMSYLCFKDILLND